MYLGEESNIKTVKLEPMKMPMMRVSSAESVGNVEELLIEILLWIPALTLIRLKCVCKQWLALISNPEFRSRHTVRNPNPKISAFFSSKIQEDGLVKSHFKSIPLGSPDGNPFKTVTDSILDGTKLRIIQSCKGLFLCNIRVCGKERKHRPVYVVNPTTNEFRALSSPNVSEDMGFFTFVRYALAYDPSKSPHYKVVCVTNSMDEAEDGHHKIDIYLSETGKWNSKHLSIPFFKSPSDEGRRPNFKMRPMHFDEHMSSESAVFCGSAVHWIRHSNFISLFIRESDVTHYFDLAEERLGLVPSPPPVSIQDAYYSLVRRYFGEYCGYLYLIQTFHRPDIQFEVMEMERDYSGWFVKYHVNLNPIMADLSVQRWRDFVVLGLFRDEPEKNDENEEKEEEDDEIKEEASSSYLWFHMRGKVVCYNVGSKAITKSVELADKYLFLKLNDFHCYLEDHIYPYMETLACA